MHNTPADAPSVRTSYLYCHLLIPHFFGWLLLLCVSLLIGGLVRPMCYKVLFNSLTAKSCYGGEKHRNPVGFYSRNSTESNLHHKHNNPQHYHHGGAVCPFYGVGYMDPPNRTRVNSSKGSGGGLVEVNNLNH